MTSPHSLVTPQGVPLGIEPAGLGSRGVALAIDVTIQGLLIGSAVLGNALIGGGTAGVVIVTLAAMTVLFGYPIVFEAAKRGQTPGKRLLHLRVQSIEGAPPTLSQSVVRSAFTLIDVWSSVGSVAVIAHLATSRGQRLGDLAAGTVVVSEPRARDVEAVGFDTPPGLEWLAERVDVSGLRPTDYRAVRQFLLRSSSLPSSTRVDLADRLAAGVVRRVGEPVPEDSSSEEYLRTIAAAVQRRSAGSG